MAGIGLVLLMSFMLKEADTNISIPNVNCLIINLEYINCTWNAHSTQEVNYTFHRLENGIYRECSTYLLQNGLAVGCRLPYTGGLKFFPLRTRLSRDESSSEQIIDLTRQVKLTAPHHLLLEVREADGSLELWLRWRVSSPSSCVESQVRHRKRDGTRWEVTRPIAGYSFTPPFFSPDDVYEFQVRVRVPEACAESKHWSDWSSPAVWGSIPPSSNAGFHRWRLDSAVYWLALAAVVMDVIG